MFKGLLAIVGSFALIKYRERIIGAMGKFGWAETYLGPGGSYRVVVIAAILLFFWGVATVTGTTDIFLGPLRQVFFPGGTSQGPPGMEAF